MGRDARKRTSPAFERMADSGRHRVWIAEIRKLSGMRMIEVFGSPDTAWRWIDRTVADMKKPGDVVGQGVIEAWYTPPT